MPAESQCTRTEHHDSSGSAYVLGVQHGEDVSRDALLVGPRLRHLGEDVERVHERGARPAEAVLLLQLVVRHRRLHHQHGALEPEHLVAVIGPLKRQNASLSSQVR